MSLPISASAAINHQTWTPQFKQYVHQSENPLSISNNDVKNVFQDEKGIIWVATASGLNYIESMSRDGNQIHFHQYQYENSNPNSIIGNVINNLYQDDQGLLWCSTSRGISIYNQYTNQFNVYRYSNMKQKRLQGLKTITVSHSFLKKKEIM